MEGSLDETTGQLGGEDSRLTLKRRLYAAVAHLRDAGDEDLTDIVAGGGVGGSSGSRDLFRGEMDRGHQRKRRNRHVTQLTNSDDVCKGKGSRKEQASALEAGLDLYLVLYCTG